MNKRTVRRKGGRGERNVKRLAGPTLQEGFRAWRLLPRSLLQESLASEYLPPTDKNLSITSLNGTVEVRESQHCDTGALLARVPPTDASIASQSTILDLLAPQQENVLLVIGQYPLGHNC